MTFCRSIYVKKVMKLLAFIFEQPSYIQVHFRGDLIMEINSIIPDHTASREQSDLGSILFAIKTT